MMYRMIVVDDEREIRKGFCNYFPWSEIGFTVVADFSSAQEADEYLQHNSVDVVVTDIRLIGMSGLELIENEYRRNSDTCFIVISGYRDFDYAQQVMRFGVRHYMVKPIKYAQILEVFTQIHRELDEKRTPEASDLNSRPDNDETENENPTVKKIKEFIHVHYEDVTLESTAQYIRMNPYYLSTYFHQHTGEKFIDYLTRARMKEAARLLTRTSLKIQDIAGRVGYSTSNSFSRSFRLTYGLSPREYRLQERNEEP